MRSHGVAEMSIKIQPLHRHIHSITVSDLLQYTLDILLKCNSTALAVNILDITLTTAYYTELCQHECLWLVCTDNKYNMIPCAVFKVQSQITSSQLSLL